MQALRGEETWKILTGSVSVIIVIVFHHTQLLMSQACLSVSFWYFFQCSLFFFDWKVESRQESQGSGRNQSKKCWKSDTKPLGHNPSQQFCPQKHNIKKIYVYIINVTAFDVCGRDHYLVINCIWSEDVRSKRGPVTAALRQPVELDSVIFLTLVPGFGFLSTPLGLNLKPLC